MPEIVEQEQRTGVEIAVIGMAGRFPGAADIHEFWDNLKKGIEAISFFSDEECTLTVKNPGVFDSPGFVKSDGGPLADKECFDAGFFDYTPRDAEVMAPQTRLLHECAYRALEDAGLDSYSYDGLIGIYAGGSSSSGWEELAVLSGKRQELGGFAISHLVDKDFAVTRLAYKLNLRGPAISLQTACSTSLVAIHLACQALLDGECDVAMAGGGKVSPRSHTGYFHREGMTRSPDAHCRAFDARAEGTIGGDGVGMVVLKPLQAAIDDRDHIHAVIKGTAVNNDGVVKAGYTAPSRSGQSDVIRVAQQVAEVEPETIGYIETHGTGTAIGDPIEFEALEQVFAGLQKKVCPIGSVKSNIGHLDVAAGVTGVIKTVLVLKHKLIPPSLHYESPNPKIDFENSHFYVNTVLREWRSNGAPLRAGVSSFGIGGTNAHVILEEWDVANPKLQNPNYKQITRSKSQITNSSQIDQPAIMEDREPGTGLEVPSHGGVSRSDGVGLSPTSNFQLANFQLIILSAKSKTALERMTANLAEYLDTQPHIDLGDAAYTLQTGRRSFPHRRMFTCSTVEDAIGALTGAGAVVPQSFRVLSKDTRTIFMFPGQGSQYVDMGRGLYESQPLFKQVMDECFEILKPVMGYDIKDLLYPRPPTPGHDASGSQGDPKKTIDKHPNPGVGARRAVPEDDINQTEITQPVIFMFEYALARLLMSWGIEPHAMTGHSIGEYTAACLAGVFTLEDALKLVALRGRLIQEIPGGSMLGISAPETDFIHLLKDNNLSLAAVNSPAQCVVAGSHEAVDAFAQELESAGIKTRRLHTSHAFHSQMIEPALEPFIEQVKQVPLNKPAIPYISNVTGKRITAAEATDPGYWAAHLRQTVRFSDGVRELLDNEHAIFVEIGPGKTLSTFVRQHEDRKGSQNAVNLIRHPKENAAGGDSGFLLKKIGQLWLYGQAVDWRKFYLEEKRYRVPLPLYPFDKHYYWLDADPVHVAVAAAGQATGKREKQHISRWVYIPSWKRTIPAALEPGEKIDFDTVAVFMDAGGVGERLADELAQQGKTVCRVKAGSAYARQGDALFTINPGNSGHYDDMFAELKSAGFLPGCIVHMWLLDPGNGEKKTGKDSLSYMQNLGFYSQLHILQAIKKHKISLPDDFRVVLVSGDLHAVTGAENLCPGKSTVMGPAKVIPQEFPNIRYQCIDFASQGLAETQTGRLSRLVMAEMALPAPGAVAAYRGGFRWLQTFERVRQDETPVQADSLLREKGVYLITGGTGKIGLLLAKYLSAAVQAKIVLTGRSSFPAYEEWPAWLSEHGEADRISRKISELRQIEAEGGQVLVFTADTADSRQMQEVIVKAEKAFGPLNGVFHCAGVTGKRSSRCPAEEITRQDCEEQFSAKVYGLPVLAEILREKEPDFVMLMSSLASVLGGLGFTAYAAANRFMDAAAQNRRRSAGTRWLSINWDGWQFHGEDGVAILPREGEILFHHLLTGHGEVQLAISTSDLHERIRRWVELESLRREEPAAGAGGSAAAASNLKDRPELSTAYAVPRSEMEQRIAGTWEHFFGFGGLGIDDDFFELGGDSLKMMTLISDLHKTLNVDIPLKEFFNRPTIKLLAEYIDDTGGGDAFSSIEPAEKKEFYALSPAQKRLYVLQELDRDSTGYNMNYSALLTGKIDRDRLEGSFVKIIERHESLRTSIELIGDEPAQVVRGAVEFTLEYYTAAEDEAKELIVGSVYRPFDLSTPPFFAAALVKTGEERHVLVISKHHIITDGLSFHIFMNDLVAFYSDIALAPLKLQYKDYSEWKNSPREKRNIELQEEYWLKQFAGKVPVLDLPGDFPRPEKRDYKGDFIISRLGKEANRKMDILIDQTGTTTYMVLLSVYSILLHKYTRQEDIVIGSPISGRRHNDLRPVLGMFVNMLAMRLRPRGDKKFGDFLAEVRETAIEAFDNQDCQFDELVMKLGIEGNLNRNPLFDTVFEMNFNEDSAERSGPVEEDPEHRDRIGVSSYPLGHQESVFDIILYAAEKKGARTLKFIYTTSLFKRSRIEKMVEHFFDILDQVLGDRDTRIKDISLGHGLIKLASGSLKEDDDDFDF